MIDDLTQVMTRQCDAAMEVEGRLRTIELLVAAGEHRFLATAVDELEESSQRLAALELARVLALHVAGAPDDLTLDDVLGAALTTEAAASLVDLADRLRTAVVGVEERRERVRGLIGQVGDLLPSGAAPAWS